MSTDFHADDGYDSDPEALLAEEDLLANLACDAEAETIAAGPDPLVPGDQVEAAPERRACPTCGRLRPIWADCGWCAAADQQRLSDMVHHGGFVGDLNVFTPPMADRRVAGRRAA